MITSNSSYIRSATCRAALIALGCAFSLALVQIPALKAADSAASPPPADKAPSLPLTATFEKVTGAERGPYVLKLTNVSKDALKASAKLFPSVAWHGDTKARNLPEHVIDPGQVWAIGDLAAADKLIITAMGFAPLELVVPQSAPDAAR
jgi:hypothetical protein